MKKTYKQIAMEILALEQEDIITSSGDVFNVDNDCDNGFVGV